MIKDPDIYKTILQTLPDIVYEIDSHGCFIYINDAIEKLGYRRNDLIGKHFSMIVHPDDLEFVQRADVLERMKGQVTGDGGAPRLFDERRSGRRLTKKLNLRLVQYGDRRKRPVEGEVVSIGVYDYRDKKDRAFLGTLGVIRDKSEIKRSEQALLHQERHYRTLLENSSDLVTILANDGTILFISRSVQRILQYETIDFIGESIYDFIAKEDENAVRDILEGRREIVKEGYSFLLPLNNRMRQKRIMESIIREVSDDASGTICFIVNSIDITERKQAEDLIRESGEKFRAILEHSKEVIVLTDPEGEVQYMSHSIEEFTGYSPFELVGKNIYEFIMPEDLSVIKNQMEEAFAEKIDYIINEFRIKKKNGAYCIVEAGISNRIDLSPINGFIYNMRDVTDIREASRALKISEDKYKNLYNSALVSMITIEAKRGMILASNDLGYSIFGYTDRVQFIGENFFEMFSEEHELESFITDLAHHERINKREMLLLKKNGESLWAAITAKYNRKEEIIDLVLLDVTNIKDTEDQIYQLTFFDSLTELPNKNLFNNRIMLEILKQKSFAVMCMGMDNFKNVNEMYGTEFGDKVLQKIAADLDEEYFKKDLVCRFAEDKFMVLLSNIGEITNEADVDAIDTIAHKTRVIFSRPFLVNRISVEVFPSIGISLYPADGDSSDILMKNAESAMYVAKDYGGNTFHYYDADLNREMMHRLELEKDLKHAIKNKEFIPYYQPKVDANGELMGMESLIRWKRNGENRLISPDEFIPIAEKNKMIVDIGLYILEESCRRNREWQEAGYDSVRVAVNLSPYQFKQNDLIPQIKNRIEKSGLDPRWLELEITESGIMENEEESIRKLNELHSMGIILSIDDFGTGYSSLGKLKNYPIDTLKIDKSFVEDIPEDVASVTLVTTIIDLAHNLGFKVVAEGVETEEQFNFLRAIRCDYFQGYYFSPPQPHEQFTSMLAKGDL